MLLTPLIEPSQSRKAVAPKAARDNSARSIAGMPDRRTRRPTKDSSIGQGSGMVSARIDVEGVCVCELSDATLRGGSQQRRWPWELEGDTPTCLHRLHLHIVHRQNILNSIMKRH